MAVRDNGPPDVGDAQPGEDLVPWVVATELEDQTAGSHSVTWIEDSSPVISGIPGNIVRVARADTADRSYANLAPDEAAERRAADAIAVGTAEAMHADLLITDRPYATGRRWGADGVTVCTPAQALPIVGLYLRSRGEFAVRGSGPGKDGLSMNRGLYYRVGSRAMLSSGWGWGTACNQHGPLGLGAVAMAVFDRFARTLRVRDDLLRAVNRSQNNDTAEDILLALDTCLLMVMGAFDSSARVAHAVLGLNRSPHGAAWQRKDWWARVDATKPTLAAIVRPGDPGINDPGSDGAALLTVLARLRNTVHASGLEKIAVVEPDTPQQTLIALPSVDQREIVDAADRLGGRAARGIRELSPGEMYAEPAILLDELLPRASQLLNELMDATPVESLAGSRSRHR